MTHGMQLFDGNGQLIFDSRELAGIPIVHDYGTLDITVPGSGEGTVFYQPIKPTTHMPRLFISTLPYLRVGDQDSSLPNWPYRKLEWFVGPFEKNASGQYYRFSLRIARTGVTQQTQGHYPPAPWKIPWTTFFVR